MLLHGDPLIVLSVYNQASLRWLAIQSKYLHRTTSHYLHLLHLNNVDPTVVQLPPHTEIYSQAWTGHSASWQHCLGLKKLLGFTSPHRGCLILDSDCFPINHNWELQLKRCLQDYSAACIVRPENLDTFGHPAACYAIDKRKLTIEMGHSTNLLGEVVEDVVCRSSKIFPLLRSNRWNPHPVAYGVYYDLFYHHTCGSRKFSIRSNSYHGRRTVCPSYKFSQGFLKQLRYSQQTASTAHYLEQIDP